MKKIISLVLALALVFTVSATAFAATETVSSLPGSSSQDVNAKLVDNTTVPTVFSVDLNWGKMQFTYTKTGTMDWDKDNHVYVDNTLGTWTADGNTVTVTNHSNDAISAKIDYKKNASYEKVEGALDVSDFIIESAENKAFDDASLSKTAALTLSGVLPADTTEFTAIGTVTVTLEKVIIL